MSRQFLIQEISCVSIEIPEEDELTMLQDFRYESALQILKTPEKDLDLEVRRLDSYSSDDLFALLFALGLVFKLGRPHISEERLRILDAWGYRLRDAMKRATIWEQLEA